MLTTPTPIFPSRTHTAPHSTSLLICCTLWHRTKGQNRWKIEWVLIECVAGIASANYKSITSAAGAIRICNRIRWCSRTPILVPTFHSHSLFPLPIPSCHSQSQAAARARSRSRHVFRLMSTLESGRRCCCSSSLPLSPFLSLLRSAPHVAFTLRSAPLSRTADGLRAQPCVVLSAAFNFHVRSLAFFSPLSFQLFLFECAQPPQMLPRPARPCQPRPGQATCCPSLFLLLLLLLSLRSHKQNYEMPLSVKSLNSLTILIYHRHRPRILSPKFHKFESTKHATRQPLPPHPHYLTHSPAHPLTHLVSQSVRQASGTCLGIWPRPAIDICIHFSTFILFTSLSHSPFPLSLCLLPLSLMRIDLLCRAAKFSVRSFQLPPVLSFLLSRFRTNCSHTILFCCCSSASASVTVSASHSLLFSLFSLYTLHFYFREKTFPAVDVDALLLRLLLLLLVIKTPLLWWI